MKHCSPGKTGCSAGILDDKVYEARSGGRELIDCWMSGQSRSNWYEP
jgi:hypothetical protein